jgi:glycosyltransferase involved in cell wall biosynthesis
LDLLVLSDRYPPFAAGGAELSLHRVLREIAREHSVHVVALMGDTRHTRTYEHEGVVVTELPNQADWPLHHLKQNGVANRLIKWSDIPIQQIRSRPAADKLFRLSRYKRYQHRQAASCLARSGFEKETAKTLLDGVLGRKRIRGGVKIDEQVFSEGWTAKELVRIFKNKDIRHLHADNYRAICFSQQLKSTTRSYFVRDHRFFCARFDQSKIINGKLCTHCSFDCAGIDAPEATKALGDLLRRNHEYRLKCLNAGGFVGTTSKFLEADLKKLLDRPVARIPNSIDDEQSTADLIRGVPQLVGHNGLIVGMLTENKGQIDLVKAWAGHLAANPDMKLHFAGRGQRIEKRIRDIAAKFDIEGQIILHGYVGRSDLFRLMASCQVVILPTLWHEPFGRVPLEAALTRRPVVSFASGGLKESIANGKTGFMVKPGDFDALFEKFEELRDDVGLARAMGHEAYRRLTKQYCIDEIVPQFSAMFGHRTMIEKAPS